MEIDYHVVEMLCVLLLIIMFQAYQIWKLEKKQDDLFELMIGLHTGEITLEEVDDDEY
jgi:hypothetical protein